MDAVRRLGGEPRLWPTGTFDSSARCPHVRPRDDGDKMFKLIVSSITGATLIAGTVAFAATSAPAADVLMVTVRDANQTQTVTKGDRLRVAVKGSGCSVHGWPNFEPKCQFDLRQPGGEARNVRVIALH